MRLMCPAQRRAREKSWAGTWEASPFCPHHAGPQCQLALGCLYHRAATETSGLFTSLQNTAVLILCCTAQLSTTARLQETTITTESKNNKHFHAPVIAATLWQWEGFTPHLAAATTTHECAGADTQTTCTPDAWEQELSWFLAPLSLNSLQMPRLYNTPFSAQGSRWRGSQARSRDWGPPPGQPVPHRVPTTECSVHTGPHTPFSRF